MTYKSILVPIDGSPAGARRIEVAARLAADHGAHLRGLAIVPPLELPQRLRSHPAAKAILEQEREKALAGAEALVKGFPQQARAAGAPSADAALAESEALEALSAAARSVDLVVLGQPDPDDLGALGTHFVENAVLQVGRPVLIVPAAGTLTQAGRKILVAWKSAAASARALADARALLERAESITVLTVADGGKGDSAEALAYLERHGLKAKAIHVQGDDAGEAIVAQAKALGADLVVMGAYGRPRLAEMILGGATRAVLRKMTTCVLMSH